MRFAITVARSFSDPMTGAFILIAAWLVSPTSEMRQLGIGDISFVGRYETLEACVTARDRFRNSPDPYNPDLVFKCVDLRD
jgi:hypothetical protein